MPIDLSALYDAAKHHSPRERVAIGSITLYVRHLTAGEVHEFQGNLAAAQAAEDGDAAAGAEMKRLLCIAVEDEDGAQVFASPDELRPLPMPVIRLLIERLTGMMGMTAEVVDAEGN